MGAMSPDDAFLQAVLESPDDDGPRLMYADWLAERGHGRREVIHLHLDPRRLASAPQLGRLTELTVTSGGLGRAGVELLAASRHASGLRGLGIIMDPVGPDGAVALVASPHLRGVTALDLTRTALGDE